jgi:serine/threonine-protein kinase
MQTEGTQKSPEKIGRYVIEGELGRGAMGVVYRASDPTIGRTVALKTMRLDVHGLDEEEMLRRFRHEARLAGVLNHPNIVTIYDAGEFESVFYIAMEYISGESLATLLDRERVLSAEKIIEISRQVCAGLDYAHQSGVIHRDIKPANIMLGDNGLVKIMDFGIAKAGEGMTSAGQVLGTPNYMSPEQVRGKPLDGRTDLFSYGVVLYQMLTGERPFTGENVTTIIYKIIHENPAPPRELDLSVHPGLSAIAVRCLAKLPEERYQSGAELVKALEGFKRVGVEQESAELQSETSIMEAAATEIPWMVEARNIAAKKSAAPASSPDLGSATGPASVQQQVGEITPEPAAQSEAPVQQEPLRTASAKIRAAKKPDMRLRILLVAIVLAALVAGIVPWRRKVFHPATVEHPPATQSAATQPSAAAPTPATGDAEIKSEPAGAKVSISGVERPEWVTPFRAEKLDPGKYDVVFSMPGHRNVTQELTVTAGQTAQLSASLPVLVEKTAIMVSSDPPGALIVLDNKFTQKLTPAEFNVKPGKHSLQVGKEGFNLQQAEIEVKRGETVTFAPKLEPKSSGNPFRAFKKIFRGGGGPEIPEGKGLVTVRSDPEGATVFHNGKPIPKTTPLEFPVNPGTYRIVLRKRGFVPETREVVVEKGKQTTLDVKLSPR